jgi:hypothetical protein
VEIPNAKWETQRKFELPLSMREAIADHLRSRWPQHTAKNAARTYDVSLDRAREAAAGRASMTTFEAMIQRGGLSVALPIVEAVAGQSIAQHLREMRTAHEENGRRLASLFGPGGSGPGPGGDRPAGRPGASADRDEPAYRRVGEG